MKRNFTKIIPTGMVITLAAITNAQEPAAPPAMPPADPTFNAMPAPTALPPLGGMGDPAAAPALGTPAPFNTGSIFGSVPASVVTTPPPLTAISPESSSAADGTTVSSPIAVNNFEFLFREDAKEGIVRERLTKEAAKQLRDKEIERIIDQNRTTMQPGQFGMMADPMMGQAGMMDPTMMSDPTLMADPMMTGMTGAAGGTRNINPITERATAEWDFYYAQLERYTEYVKTKLLPKEGEILPESSYAAANIDDVLNERKSLKDEYDQAAVAAANREYMTNREFYERLQKREDRRSAYYEWLSMEQRKLEEWTAIWSRKTNGTRWTTDDEIRRDDWYYGTNFNAQGPVKITVDNRKYLLSREPQANLEPGELNVISNNLTPYDIIDHNGEMKNRVMEIHRGTIVVPPAPGSRPAGTIEISQ